MVLPYRIPPLPAILVLNKTRIIAGLPAPGSMYRPAAWRNTFDNDPDLDFILRRFPGQITRDQVASLYTGAATNYRRLLLAVMIWSYTIGGLGPYRTKRILEHAMPPAS
jgi:hypothetical protein